MNAFLMHPDRDFDLGGNLPFNEAALEQDLELGTLYGTMAQGDKFLSDIARHALLSGVDGPEEIRYRQDVLKDCLEHPEVVRAIYRIPIQAMENKRLGWMGVYSHYPGGILSGARGMLQVFVAALRELRQIADGHAKEFESEGFRRFFGMIQRELDDEYFTVIEEHLKELAFRRGVLLSVELGKGNEGTNHILRKRNRGDRNWIRRVVGLGGPVYSFTLDPRDHAGGEALSGLRDRGLNLVANAAARSADHIESFLKALQRELAFYIGCLNLAGQLAQLGEPIAFPAPSSPGEGRHAFRGLYDLSLALTMKKEVVGNDVNADKKDLIVITGANQGGKTTFLRSVGIAQLMMQCGMFVSADAFSASVCKGLFTHFKREEDSTMKSGKFDEELGRMSDMVDRLKPHAMMLFNESFAATNEREGSEIARQITSALLDMKVKVFYVTHLYELANGFYQSGMDNALFLRAERKPDGERTFKLVPGRPLQTSYGRDVYEQVFGGGNGEAQAAGSSGARSGRQ
jgi:hypothetical protein